MVPTRLMLALALLFSLAACGGGGGGGGGTVSDASSPVFGTTLRAPQWQDGDWVFDELGFIFHLWDEQGGVWRKRQVTTGVGTLTLHEGGVRGSTAIRVIQEGSTGLRAPGDTLGGFTVGEGLEITGHVDGTTVALTCTSPAGDSLRILLAPYDGDVNSDASGRWNAADRLVGISSASLSGTYGASNAYLQQAVRVGPASQTPLPEPVSFGDEPSVFQDGSYVGDGYTFVVQDQIGFGWTYQTFEYDLALTITGNTIEGTATLTLIEDFPDFDGYVENDVIPMKGTIIGNCIFLEAADPMNPDFAWRLYWSEERHEVHTPQIAPGSLTEFTCEYGVHTQTDGIFGGECGASLTRQ